jgi:putative transposase
MPRSSRIVVPATPHHVIQRGHNRQVVFATDEDYQYYLDNLWEWKAKLGCRIFAYCLMTNHVHLIIDPGQDEARLALLMKRVAGRQTRYVNRLERRSGTLWEGRYKSSPIQTDEYLLACCRYIELNPVRAGLVSEPAQYPWSSYRCKIGQLIGGQVDLDVAYLALGTTPVERAERYATWIRSAIPPGEWEQLRQAVQRGHITGTNKFIGAVAAKLRRRIECRRLGRPNKTNKSVPL